MISIQKCSALQGEDQLDFECGILQIECQWYRRTKERAVGARNFLADSYENSKFFGFLQHESPNLEAVIQQS